MSDSKAASNPSFWVGLSRAKWGPEWHGGGGGGGWWEAPGPLESWEEQLRQVSFPWKVSLTLSSVTPRIRVASSWHPQGAVSM